MTKPNAAADLVAKRIEALKGRKSQRQIAEEVGFPNQNILSMLKTGKTKIPLDRVPALATALECDPAPLFRLALEQTFEGSALMAVRNIFKTVLTENELAWIELLRSASGNSDPHLTARRARIIRAVFGDPG